MKVPENTNKISLDVPVRKVPRLPAAIPAAFGEDVAKSQERLGMIGDKIAEHLKTLAYESQEKENLRRETLYRQEMQGYLFDQNDETVKVGDQDVTRKKGFLLRQLGHAKGATEDLDKIYNQQIREKYLKGLSQFQLDRLTPAMDNYYLTLRNRVITHEANQLDEDLKNETQANLKQKVLDATTIRDEKQLAYAIDDAIKSTSTYNNRYDEATRKMLNEKTAEEVAKAAIISTIEQTGSYQMAKIMLDGIKNKISPATFSSLTDEIGSRAVDMAIAADMSLTQEDSSIMKELQKAKGGMFGYLSTTDRNKAIKDLQHKIYYNSQIAKRENEKLRDVRNDDILAKLDSLTLADIEKEMAIPENQGGIPRKQLASYKRAIQNGIAKDLNTMLKEKNDREPTERAKKVKGYLDLIDSFIDDVTDKWHAREKLADAYADGIVNKGEAIFLNNLQKNLKDIEFNRSTGKIVGFIRGIKNWLNQYNASDDEIALRIKQLLGTVDSNQAKPEDEVKKITLDHLKDKLPEINTLPEGGQLLYEDGAGNLFTVKSDGSIEPYIQKANPEEKRKPSGEGGEF